MLEISFKRPIRLFCNLLLFGYLISCTPATENAQGAWIVGTEQEKLGIIERQFRGFDMAMVEVGYRYQELYWAGVDENWEYADYQIEKIKIALNDGSQRRPLREASGKHFMEVVIPNMKEAITRKDTAVFSKSFLMLSNQCNACHAMEKVSFFKVKTPLQRQSPIRN